MKRKRAVLPEPNEGIRYGGSTLEGILFALGGLMFVLIIITAGQPW